jgi:hypothetical protein
MIDPFYFTALISDRPINLDWWWLFALIGPANHRE